MFSRFEWCDPGSWRYFAVHDADVVVDDYADVDVVDAKVVDVNLGPGDGFYSKVSVGCMTKGRLIGELDNQLTMEVVDLN